MNRTGIPANVIVTFGFAVLFYYQIILIKWGNIVIKEKEKWI